MKTEIVIIGPLKLQNELLAYFLNKEAGLKCHFQENNNLTELIFKNNGNANTLIIMKDCHNLGSDPVWTYINHSASKCDRLLFCLFNVRPDQGIGRDAVSRGIKGVFYEGDSLELICKGIEAISKGELWFSRKVITNYLTGYPGPLNATEKKINLTKREVEILGLLASGASNSRISEELCISLNTVKTHMYNIFKKIDAPNRLQATLWAASNLKNYLETV